MLQSPELKDQLKQISGKPYADVYTKDLITKFRINQSVGQATEASRVMKMYGELFSKPFPEDLAKMPVVAQLVQVLDNEDKTVEFSLPRSPASAYLLDRRRTGWTNV